MKNYIGYPLKDVLNALVGYDIEIIYNTKNADKDEGLYVTNMIFEGKKCLITVSYFKIEVK